MLSRVLTKSKFQDLSINSFYYQNNFLINESKCLILTSLLNSDANQISFYSSIYKYRFTHCKNIKISTGLRINLLPTCIPSPESHSSRSKEMVPKITLFFFPQCF